MGDGSCGVLGEGSLLELAVPADAPVAARFLLCSGVPLREPVARYGPFVMNTVEEIHQAVQDFRDGRMGEIGSLSR